MRQVAIARDRVAVSGAAPQKTARPNTLVIRDDDIGRSSLSANGDSRCPTSDAFADGPRRGLLVHHYDAEREWAYDRASHIGRLERGLDEAEGRGWVVVSMRNDWLKVWPE